MSPTYVIIIGEGERVCGSVDLAKNFVPIALISADLRIQ